MKHWNRQPHVRATWHRVLVDAKTYKRYYYFDHGRADIKKQCWDHASPGRFYMEPLGAFHYHVWFELAEDAVWFRLKWT